MQLRPSSTFHKLPAYTSEIFRLGSYRQLQGLAQLLAVPG